MPGIQMPSLPKITGWQWLRAIPPIYSLPILLLALFAGMYVLCFGLTTPVPFRYAGANCISRWTLLPDAQQALHTNPFSVTYQGKISLWNHNLAARQTCFTLQAAARPGDYSLQFSPLGNAIATNRYQVTLPLPPQISITALSKPIPLTKPVLFTLSDQDDTFTYAIQANDRESKCQIHDRQLSCGLADLNLSQGQSYRFAITRYFGKKVIAKVEEKETEILRATTVTDTSIKPDEVVLAKPTELIIHFDKQIAQALATISRIGIDAPEKMESNVEIGENQIKIMFDELPRQAEFEVKVDSLVAQDGSSLVEPYSIRFKTSGGPRVSKVSIPTSGIPLGSSAVISFDQELDPNQNVASLVSLEGGAATIYRSGNSVVVGLNGVGKCTDFTIKVTNDVQSKYGISGSSAWSYSSRTICHTLQVYGYSVKGRPLLAYVFGSGSTAVLFTGAIHGNEVSSSYLMDSWIKELEANARNLPSGKQIVVIPEVNPDGIAAGMRNNANNVDLNRNFAVSDWQKDITDTFGRPIPNGGGSEPMSEPETKALANLTSQLKPQLTMSFHSIGGVVIANQAGNSSALAQSYSRLTGYGNATGQSSQTFDYAISGTYDDWIAEKLGLPSVLVELGSHTYSQFPLNQTALWEMVRR